MQQLITQSAPGTAQQTHSASGGELAGTDECGDFYDIAALPVKTEISQIQYLPWVNPPDWSITIQRDVKLKICKTCTIAELKCHLHIISTIHR